MTRFGRRRPRTSARAARHRLGLPSDAVVCLFVGRLSREKGLMDLVEAWRASSPANGLPARRGAGHGRSSVGRGPGRARVRGRHILAASVRFLGLDRRMSPRSSAPPTSLVQPSHFEALGLSAVEALASGVPVIASAVGGLLDFIDRRRERQALSARRIRLPWRPAFVRSLTIPRCDGGWLATARASVVDEYDERVVFSRFASLLRQLAGRGRERPSLPGAGFRFSSTAGTRR